MRDRREHRFQSDACAAICTVISRYAHGRLRSAAKDQSDRFAIVAAPALASIAGYSRRFMDPRPSRPGDPRGKLEIMSRSAKTGQKGGDRTGIRDGEVAVELPAEFAASLYFIGRIRTPCQTREACPKNGRETEEVCTIELDPRWAAGLQGLET